MAFFSIIIILSKDIFLCLLMGDLRVGEKKEGEDMSDTKAIIVFIALSIALLLGIRLLPKSESILVIEKPAAVSTYAVDYITRISHPALGQKIPAGYTVKVKEY